MTEPIETTSVGIAPEPHIIRIILDDNKILTIGNIHLIEVTTNGDLLLFRKPPEGYAYFIISGFTAGSWLQFTTVPELRNLY